MRERFRGLFFRAAGMLVLFVLTGCTVQMRFYPVQGPLASANPSQVFLGKITGTPGTRSGGFSAVLGKGETFQGRWTMVPTGAQAANTGLGTPQGGISSVWDSVYGNGFYVAHVLGQRQYGRASVTGSNGTALTMEIFSPNSGGEPKAVAKDDQGNVFKVVAF